MRSSLISRTPADTQINIKIAPPLKTKSKTPNPSRLFTEADKPYPIKISRAVENVSREYPLILALLFE
jgi:hypothetical protein